MHLLQENDSKLAKRGKSTNLPERLDISGRISFLRKEKSVCLGYNM